VIAISAFFLVFRLLHIVAGTLWVGMSFMFLAVIGPTAGQLGPAAGPFMTALGKKAPGIITPVATVTVLAGWALWLRDWSDFGSLGDWVTSRYGLVLTIGAVLATVAYFGGAFGTGPTIKKMSALGEQIAAAGGPPSPEQQAELARLQGVVRGHGMRDLPLLLLAVAAMATARYW
jgi:hypothetical protein